MNDTPLGQLNLQVHRELAPAFDAAALAADAEAIARRTPGVRGFAMSEGEDQGGYVNLTFACESPADAWPPLRDALFALPGVGAALPAASICLATGAHGWDDCVVLHHFDPSVPLGAVAGEGGGEGEGEGEGDGDGAGGGDVDADEDTDPIAP